MDGTNIGLTVRHYISEVQGQGVSVCNAVHCQDTFSGAHKNSCSRSTRYLAFEASGTAIRHKEYPPELLADLETLGAPLITPQQHGEGWRVCVQGGQQYGSAVNVGDPQQSNGGTFRGCLFHVAGHHRPRWSVLRYPLLVENENKT
ncbi:hypothetical protein E2C01_025305 [Portunus trituberculatus]|uniref:Uncharacterized protein n=1 Tax=Portunus trituberculatus TaxID=210409 RepID=A0A5B7EHJ8_PORTR|nr:hypothetical protein [Portunus trituberculatus]